MFSLHFPFDFGWGMACISPLVLVQPGLAWCTHVMYLIPEDIEGWVKVSGVLFARYLPNYLYKHGLRDVDCGGREHVCVSFGSGRDGDIIYIPLLRLSIVGCLCSLIRVFSREDICTEDGGYTVVSGSNPGVDRKTELEKPELISMQEHDVRFFIF